MDLLTMRVVEIIDLDWLDHINLGALGNNLEISNII